MDFDQLITFLEVARHSSFSRAAEKRFRTQPAISSQVRALEDEIGAKLFDRSGGKVSLTAAGKLFQKYSEEALESRREIVNALAEMERTPRGEIIVGANEATCLYVLPHVFAQFKRQYPKVAVNISRSERAKILESVIDNTVDFGVVSAPVGDARLSSVIIHKDELVVIVQPQHALAQLTVATPAELYKYPLLLPRAGRTREALDELFLDEGLQPNISMELDSSELMKRFVAADVGIGFIARSNVDSDLVAGTLAVVPLARTIRRDLALIFRKDKALSRAAMEFIDIAVKSSGVVTPKQSVSK